MALERSAASRDAHAKLLRVSEHDLLIAGITQHEQSAWHVFVGISVGPLLGQKGVRTCQLSSVRLVSEATCHQWRERLDLSAMLPEDSCLPAFFIPRVCEKRCVLCNAGVVERSEKRPGRKQGQA